MRTFKYRRYKRYKKYSKCTQGRKLCFIAGMVFSISVWSSDNEKNNHYETQVGVKGKAVSVGSDTMANMMELWAEAFEKRYPQTSIEVDATGSSTAPTALIEGVASIGSMSRELKQSEIQAFEKAYGYPPTILKVALDAIAIYVERRNPVVGLTVQQIDAIFSATRFCGAPNNIEDWQQLGINIKGGDNKIRTYGRNSVSGTYGSFKVSALCKGDFKKNVNEQPGSASVVMSVASSKPAIGYAAIGYKTAGVKAVSIGTTNANYVAPTANSVRTGQYPFSRFLYLVVNKKPNEALPLLEREFLRFVLSREGQAMVTKDGYFPIPEVMAYQQKSVLAQ